MTYVNVRLYTFLFKPCGSYEPGCDHLPQCLVRLNTWQRVRDWCYFSSDCCHCRRPPFHAVRPVLKQPYGTTKLQSRRRRGKRQLRIPDGPNSS